MAGSEILFWDDLEVGRSWEFGSYEVTTDEIVEFAGRYDPFPMHVDPDLAVDTPLGVFCASGIHTFGMTQKMLFDNLYVRTRLIAGAEIRRFIMSRPVVPGDVLKARIEVIGRIAHHRRADAGWVELHCETLRADGAKVLQFDPRILFERRPA